MVNFDSVASESVGMSISICPKSFCVSKGCVEPRLIVLKSKWFFKNKNVIVGNLESIMSVLSEHRFLNQNIETFLMSPLYLLL